MKSLTTIWLAIVVLASAGDRRANCDEATRDWTVERTGSDRITIILPATDGRVAVSSVASALSEAAGLDDSVLTDWLPEGKDINLNSRRVRAALRGAQLATGGVIDADVKRDKDGEPNELVLVIRRDKAREKVNRGKEVVRDSVEWLAGDDEAGNYGLHWQPLPKSPREEAPVVVLIHGYSAGEDHLAEFTRVLTTAGYRCGQFLYRNDAAIEESAAALDDALRTHQQQHPADRLVLLTHSMGGLVARSVIESSAPPRVERLIMVAPPNHGSDLAELPLAGDIWEQVIRAGEWNPVVWLKDGTADGLNEARQDLKSDSKFLRQLNGRPRNPDVKYTIVLGDAAPLSADTVERTQQGLDMLKTRSRVARLVSPRVERMLQASDELVRGTGDGLVSVESGRLDGVDDVVVLPVTHGAFRRAESGADGQSIAAVVLERLRQTDSRGLGQ
jgi:pimeloyl-ACP methyl ester carboxylesterase